MNAHTIDQSQLNKISQQLLECILSHDNMQALVDLAAEIVGNPIAVGNARMTVLYVSKDMPESVPMSHPGVIPPDYFTHHSFIKYNEEAYYSNQPVLTEEQFGGYKTLLVRLNYQNDIIGYMSILFANKLYSPEIDEIALLLRHAIEFQISRNVSIFSKPSTMAEILLTDILNHQNADFTGNADAITQLGINKQADFYILVFNMLNFSKANMPGGAIKDQLHQLTGSDLSIYYGENIVLVRQHAIKDLYQDTERYDALIAFIKTNGLCGGISYVCKQIADIRRCYHQALQALNYAKSHGIIDLIPYDYYVISNFTKNTVAKRHLEYKLPELEDLEAYDRAHRSDYIRLLQTYLENGKNVNQTAQALGMSRSSAYRGLEMIKQITGLDFDRNAHLFSMYFGIKMMKDTQL